MYEHGIPMNVCSVCRKTSMVTEETGFRNICRECMKGKLTMFKYYLEYKTHTETVSFIEWHEVLGQLRDLQVEYTVIKNTIHINY